MSFLLLQDKIVFSLLLAITIMLAEKDLKRSDVMFLLAGAHPKKIKPNPVQFLSPQAWAEFNA